jgi:uncharacterized protein YfaQ (DUF2300 family)
VRSLVLTLALAAPAIAVQEIPAGLALAPAALVSGTTLSVADLNFRLDGPKGWRWLKAQNPKGPVDIYVAQNPATDVRYSVLVVATPEPVAMGQDTAKRFLQGLLAQRESVGWQVDASSCAIATAVASGAYRCRVRATMPDKTAIVGAFYLVARERHMYVLSLFDREEQEPALFTEFVKSLRFLS